MTHFLQLALLLALMVAAAKCAGALAHRIGQPSVFGEILAGLVLGPTLLNVLAWPPFAEPLTSAVHGAVDLSAAKAIGCGFFARLCGFSNRESVRVGAGMISRGEVGLIVAGYGLTNGLIDRDVFSGLGDHGACDHDGHSAAATAGIPEAGRSRSRGRGNDRARTRRRRGVAVEAGLQTRRFYS
jgi:Kef-type K+ transport system membrane component KefB